MYDNISNEVKSPRDLLAASHYCVYREHLLQWFEPSVWVMRLVVASKSAILHTTLQVNWAFCVLIEQ
jgi:hypothetical protein